MKSKLRTILIGTGIGIIFLLIWLRFVDIETMKYYLKNLKLHFVIIAAIFYIFAYYIRSLRWRLLLHRVQPITRSKSFLIHMAGNFTNYLIPLRAGELMKCYFVKKLYGTRMTRTLPSVFVDKLFDTIGILFVLLLVPILSVSLPPLLTILIFVILLILFIGLFILFAAIYSGEKVIGFLKRICFFVPARYEEKLDETLSLFVDGLAVFKDQKHLIFPVMILSLIAILFDSFFFFSLFRAFSTEVNYFYVLLGYTLIYLSYIIPHPPAQLGSNELIMTLIFAAGFGMQAEMSGAIMIFSHILTGLIIVTIGIFAYSYAGIKLMTIMNKGDDFYE